MKFYNKYRDPMSTLTHLIGLILSVIGTIFLFFHIFRSNYVNTLTVISVLAFGFGLICLYFASTTYHAYQGDEATLKRLKKLDHAMIFFLIAGSYTPFCLLSLSGTLRIIILTVIWVIAILGVLMMIFWIDMPRWLNLVLYIGMGWVAVFALKPLYESLSLPGFLLLLIGGIMYTVGGIIYGLKKPNFSKEFGFHEIFHVFVMLGSLCHYLVIYNYVLKS